MKKEKLKITKRKVKWNELYENLIKDRDDMLEIDVNSSIIDILENNAYKYVCCNDIIQIIEGWFDTASKFEIETICDYELLLSRLYNDWIDVDIDDDSYAAKMECVEKSLYKIVKEKVGKK